MSLRKMYKTSTKSGKIYLEKCNQVEGNQCDKGNYIGNLVNFEIAYLDRCWTKLDKKDSVVLVRPGATQQCARGFEFPHFGPNGSSIR